MKKILCALVIFFTLTVKAQVMSVSLQAAGLTCSMCSNAINKALQSIDFVAGVQADLKSYTFEISLKPGHPVDFNLIRAKVEKAGFSITSLTATVQLQHIMLKKNEPLIVGGNSFLLLNDEDRVIHGFQKLTLLDKGFVSSKAFKKRQLSTLPSNTYHAII